MQLTDLPISLSHFLLTVAMVTDWLRGVFRKARTLSHFLKCSIYYVSNKKKKIKKNNRQKDRRCKSTHKSLPSLTWWAEFTACPSLFPTVITAIDCCRFELISVNHLAPPDLNCWGCSGWCVSSSLEAIVWPETKPKSPNGCYVNSRINLHVCMYCD